MAKKNRGVVGAVAAALLVAASLFGVNEALKPGGGLYETKRTLWPVYQATPRSWDKWGPNRSLGYQIDKMAERLNKHRGDGYQLRASSADEWSRTRSLVETMNVLQSRMSHGKVGLVYFAKAKKDQYQERIRKRDLNPAKATATEGTDAIDIVVGTLRAHFPQIHIGGIYECRTTISGGISQHAHANAVDVTASYSYMDKVAHVMLNWTRKDFVPVSQILWNYKNLLTGYYVYDHTSHIHFSGSPLINTFGCSRPGSRAPTTEGVSESEDEYGQPAEAEEEFVSPPPGLGATGPTG